MTYEALRSRADFVVRTDEAGKQVLETSRSTVLVPKVHWNGLGIKWLDEGGEENND